ncbi:MlaD family protein [Fibrobacter sp. UBA2449]|uniref:MlaD family protein n=1 Tax=Fibrobacter sp. UBA2449 TaxID=1946529 RepID=UPI0025BC00E0|nr:MlaD family protein [Fibrobacter sp. UBA2449]
MKISDKAIGYFSLLALLGLFAGIAYGMFEAHEKVTYKAYVDFKELGSLQPEDPVVIRGYTVGTIGKVTWLGDRARVEIKFDEPRTIREGTKFNNVNYAIMGQRRLEIVPNKNGKVLPEDFIHQGNFEPGIAEALRYMEDVNEQLNHVREVITLITEGDSTHKSVKEIYETVMQTTEGILDNADKTLDKLSPAIKQLVGQLNQAANSVADMANQVDTTVKVTTDALNEKIAQADSAIHAITEGTKKAEQIIATIESTPAVDKLLNTKDLVDRANDLVKKTQALIAAIDTKGVKMYDDQGKEVRLFTWKNTNLIGKTAREKAKLRAEKGESLPDSGPAESE